MEVHHHPDLHHRNKHCKEYFLEFLMIFLAVTLGFFAESLRENISNKEREQHYMLNLIRDLKVDTVVATNKIKGQNLLLSEMDSAFQIPTEQIRDLNKQDTFFYHFLPFFNQEFNFTQDDITLIQLKNTGGYSVIGQPGVADSIIALVNNYAEVKSNEEFYHDDFIKVEDFTSRIIKVPYIGDCERALHLPKTSPSNRSVYTI